MSESELSDIVSKGLYKTLSWVYWCFTSHATIFQSYMWRHRCAGGLKKLYLRSGSQRHRHFAGFFNVPVLYRHGTTVLCGDSDTSPHLVAFTTRWGYGGRILDLNPRRPHGGHQTVQTKTAKREKDDLVSNDTPDIESSPSIDKDDDDHNITGTPKLPAVKSEGSTEATPSVQFIDLFADSDTDTDSDSGYTPKHGLDKHANLKVTNTLCYWQ